MLSDLRHHIFLCIKLLLWRDNISQVKDLTRLLPHISPVWAHAMLSDISISAVSIFSARSVTYKFRLLNSTSSELTQPAAVNAECRSWQRKVWLLNSYQASAAAIHKWRGGKKMVCGWMFSWSSKDEAARDEFELCVLSAASTFSRE